MDRKEWDALERVVQDQLASKFGLTRSGENNSVMNSGELSKIPEAKKEIKEVKEDDKPKEKTREVSTKKRTKSSKRGKSTK